MVAISGRLTGRSGRVTELRPVELGPLSLLLGPLEARYVSFAGLELIRRLFVAVRDVDWGTAPAEDVESSLDEPDGSHIRASMTAVCRNEPHGIDLSWRGSLSADASGVIRFAFDGVARRRFRYARIGICILHPPSFAGGHYRAHTTEGWMTGGLDQLIQPQLPGEHGFGEPLFPAFDELELYRPDEIGVRLQLRGDLFELEDQRNWTDASYKAYSTPLHLGEHVAETNERFSQEAVVTPIGAWRRPAARRSTANPTVSLGQATAATVPAVGIILADPDRALQPSETDLLLQLGLAHLRVDLLLAAPDAEQRLAAALATAEQLTLQLELAVTIPAEAPAPLASLARRLAGFDGRLARLLVFRQGCAVTPGPDVAALQQQLQRVGLRVPVYGGTDRLFADLNGSRPSADGPDGLAFPLVPTVHADDDLSLIETMPVFGDVIQTARSFAGQLPLAVTPVTFRERPAADERQDTLLGAVWTTGTAAALTTAGADAITYFESSGPGGVITLDGHNEHAVVPSFHVLADLAEWRGRRVVAAASSDPLRAAALATQGQSGLGLLVANAQPTEETISLRGLPSGRYRVRSLNEASYTLACSDPAGFRRSFEAAEVEQIALAPYEVIRVEAKQ